MPFRVWVALTQIAGTGRTAGRSREHLCRCLAAAQGCPRQVLEQPEEAQGLCQTLCKSHGAESFSTVKACVDKSLAWFSPGQAAL